MPEDLNPISRFLEMSILFIAILPSRTKQKSPSRIVIKTRSIDVTMSPHSVVVRESEKLRKNNFHINQTINLDPFDKDHALVHATYSSGNIG